MSGQFGRLSQFDAFIVLASVSIATLLMGVRRLRGLDQTARQWLDDALNLGAIIVLGVLVFSSFPWWSAPIAASPLTDIALTYCGGLIAAATYRSILKPKA